MIRPGDGAAEAVLDAAGWGARDETVIFRAAADAFPAPPAMAAFALWPPLAVQADLWAEGGIGPARLAIMDRAAGPRAALLGRVADRAAGAAFVALGGGTAFLHALTVLPAFRRCGCARHLLQAAAAWARAQGAQTLALAVTRANVPAVALYASQGMQAVGHYHYRSP
jgi:GNAT superfamily N-acetyltransferase